MKNTSSALIVAATLCGLLVTGCAKSADSTSASDASASAAPAATAAADASSGAMSASSPAASSSTTQTVASAGDAAHGNAIFSANCASCHGAAGAGGGIGPSLKGEKSRKNTAAAIAWIKNPMQPMPKLYPSPLSEKDVADVAAYVESL